MQVGFVELRGFPLLVSRLLAMTGLGARVFGKEQHPGDMNVEIAAP
jgi:hypothetical protein